MNVLTETLSHVEKPLKLYAELIVQRTYSWDNRSVPFLTIISKAQK
jgi:hypothetical protein